MEYCWETIDTDAATDGELRDEVTMADEFDGNACDETPEYSLGHVIDEVVEGTGVITCGEIGSLPVLFVGTASRLISISP